MWRSGAAIGIGSVICVQFASVQALDCLQSPSCEDFCRPPVRLSDASIRRTQYFSSIKLLHPASV